jgi:hypothetical protein
MRPLKGASIRKTLYLLENIKLIWKGLHRVEVNNSTLSGLRSFWIHRKLIVFIQLLRIVSLLGSLDNCKSRTNVAPPVRQWPFNRECPRNIFCLDKPLVVKGLKFLNI